MERLTNNQRSGFSLVELLVVMAIALVLLGLVVSSFNGVSRAFALTTAGESLRDVLVHARQQAITNNRAVEVRFCRKNSTSPITDVQVIMHQRDGTLTLLSKNFKISEGVVLETVDTRSTLFDEDLFTLEFTANTLAAFLINDSSTYQVFSFVIFPDGSTNIPWTTGPLPSLTIRSSQDSNNPPKNYAAIQLDPANGRVSMLRP